LADVEVPSQDGDELQDGNVAGVWHAPWNQAIQGQWVEQLYKIALSKPFVSAVTYSNLADADDSVIAHSGLLTAKLEPKESFQMLKSLHDSVFSG